MWPSEEYEGLFVNIRDALLGEDFDKSNVPGTAFRLFSDRMHAVLSNQCIGNYFGVILNHTLHKMRTT